MEKGNTSLLGFRESLVWFQVVCEWLDNVGEGVFDVLGQWDVVEELLSMDVAQECQHR